MTGDTDENNNPMEQSNGVGDDDNTKKEPIGSIINQNNNTSSNNNDSNNNMTTKKRRRDDEPSNNIVGSSSHYSSDIPLSTNHYHISYMHKSVITCSPIVSVKYGYVVSGDSSGIVKFWKRIPVIPSGDSTNAPKSSNDNNTYCLEFVKSFVAHAGPVQCLCMDDTGDVCVSVGPLSSSSAQQYVMKWYDIVTFDVTHMITTSLVLGYMATLFTSDNIKCIAISAGLQNSCIYVFVADQQQCVQTISLHAGAVTCMMYLSAHHCIVSTDNKGIVEVWNCTGTSSSSAVIQNNTSNNDDDYDKNDNDIDDDLMNNDNELNTMNESTFTLSVGGKCTFHKNGIQYTSKFDTDFILLLKKKVYIIAMTYTTIIRSNKATTIYATYCTDHKIRIFDHATGKLLQSLDERIQVYDHLMTQQQLDVSRNKKNAWFTPLDHMEYGKRVAVENEISNESTVFTGGVSASDHASATTMNNNHHHQNLTIQFDPVGKYLLVPSMIGIKVWDWQKRQVVSVIGQPDSSTLRFINVCIAPGNSKLNQQMQLARNSDGGGAMPNRNTADGTDQKKQADDELRAIIPNDALIIATAYDQRRLYIFSHYDPVEHSDQRNIMATSKKDKTTTNNNNSNDVLTLRDVWNEAPTAQDQLYNSRSGGMGITSSLSSTTNRLGGAGSTAATKTTTAAILRTTMGDIHIQLYDSQTPKTVENFIGHAQSGYYDNVSFHRIIPNFMLQTGDPLGDGTGGESIWGNEFEDEIVPQLKHDKPFIVSMANAGPNTNGSQFFITTVPTPWLDGKHTIFGRVIKGMDICTLIERVKTDDNDKPLDDVRILNVDLN